LKKKLIFVDEFKSAKTPELLRIRRGANENRDLRPSKVITTKENDTLINDLFKDDDYLAVQILKEVDNEQKIDYNENECEQGIYLTIRKRTTEKKFSPGIEKKFLISDLIDFDSFIKKIKSIDTEFDKIQNENVLLFKFLFHSKLFIELKDHNQEETKVSFSEFYKIEDGDIIVIKDNSDDPNQKDLFQNDIQEKSKQETRYYISNNTIVSYRSNVEPEKEKQLKINYEDDDSPKKKKENNF
jgi:hypothetical protein